jgi:hypothetical protein
MSNKAYFIRSLRILATIASLVAVSFCPSARPQENKAFPTNGEISLVVTQTTRALSDYEASVKLEEKLGAKDADLANDRRVIHGLKVMVDSVGVQPQKFNSWIGFTLVTLLDDASRNAALCNADAIQKGLKLTLVGDVNTAQEFLQLAQACTSVSNLLYTISENTTALYERYIRGEQGLAVEAVDAMNKCIDTLKAQK